MVLELWQFFDFFGNFGVLWRHFLVFVISLSPTFSSLSHYKNKYSDSNPNVYKVYTTAIPFCFWLHMVCFLNIKHFLAHQSNLSKWKKKSGHTREFFWTIPNQRTNLSNLYLFFHHKLSPYREQPLPPPPQTYIYKVNCSLFRLISWTHRVLAEWLLGRGVLASLLSLS